MQSDVDRGPHCRLHASLLVTHSHHAGSAMTSCSEIHASTPLHPQRAWEALLCSSLTRFYVACSVAASCGFQPVASLHWLEADGPIESHNAFAGKQHRQTDGGARSSILRLRPSSLGAAFPAACRNWNLGLVPCRYRCGTPSKTFERGLRAP